MTDPMVRPLDELDLALVHALQIRPRATWTELAEVLEVHAVTLARRWSSLTEAGLAWMTCYPKARADQHTQLAYVRIRCAAEATHRVVAALLDDHQVVNLHLTTGEDPLVVSVTAPDPGELARYLVEHLAILDGVLGLRSEVVTQVHVDATAWRLRALGPAQRRALQTPQSERRTVGHAPDDRDLPLVTSLLADGRQSLTRMARELGMTEPTLRRRLQDMLVNQRAVLRCEIAQAVSGWPCTMMAWLSCPGRSVAQVVAALTEVPELRSCVSVSGPANLLAVFWLRQVADMERIDGLVTSRIGNVQFHDRVVCLQTVKLMGGLLDAHGRRTGHVEVQF